MPAVTPTLIMGVLGIVLSAPAWVLFIRAARRLYLFIAAGQPAPGRTNRPLRRGVQVLKEVFFHTELMRRPAIAVAHWFVMVGFLIGSLVWFEAYIQTFNPAGGWPLLSQWSLYHFAEEVLAIGTVLGIGFLFAIRLSTGMRERLSRFYGSNALSAFFVEGVIFLEGAGMLLVKAGKIATYGHASPWADFFTQYLAGFLPASPIMVSVFALFKLLVGMVWLVVVARNLTWGVAWHRFLAFFNIFFQRNPDGAPALGKVLPLYDGTTELTIDTIEEDSSLGIGHLQDASWKMLLDAATCTECGRCQTQCPSWNTGKPLSPKLFVTDIRDAAVANASYLQDPDTFATDTTYSDVDLLKLVGDSNVIHPDVLWSCTNCGACVEQCPVDIEHIDHVVNMRRFQVLAESDFPSELVGMFKNLEVKGNPWGRNNAERASWITEARRDGIEVPVFGEDAKSFDDIEYLFWVGCAGAFDDDGKRTTRAVVELLHTAGVKFAVLSKAERCTGDPARRAGNEFLFQQLALENIDTLNGVFSGVPKGQRKIITTCPHCFNTFRNEYPDFDGYFDVFHRLVRDKLLTPIPRGPKDRKPITYHDPCFLGRHNKVFDPPRELLGATGADLVEMPRNRNEGFCCGAGGARMFMEENLGTRINENRAAEAVATGAAEIAVGCPFCNTMMVSGVKAVADATPAPAVRDVAQMLRDSVLVDGHLPDPRPKQFLQPPIREKREEKPEPKPAGKSAKPQASPAKPASPTTAVGRTQQPGISPVVAPPGAAKPAVPGAAAPGAAIPGSTVPPAPGAAIPGGAMPPAATPPGATPPGARPATLTPPGTAVPGTAMPGSVVPPAATPKAMPPKAAPPTAQPPVARPPAATAPTAPAAPGGSVPKTVAPGATIPGTARPPVAKPPAPTPPTAKPPAAVPPVAKPPTATPPGAMPPGSRPAASPVAKPPAAKPPVAQPPVAKPPMAKPPMVPPSKDISQDTDKDQEQP